MPDLSAIAAGFEKLGPEELRSTLKRFLPAGATSAESTAAIEAALRSPMGESLRDVMARWIVDGIVPVERLVPKAYIRWRPPVREAMMFVVARLSPARLAPKLLEQIELPPATTPETRLLRLIAKVPGLQKLGQVIARNQHLHPSLRAALAKLENGIRDVKPRDIRAIIERELGPKIQTFNVKISDAIVSEASVSAVVRFTWRNPDTGRRERGVFKVLKPHIPEYFAEDMQYLQGLANHFGDRRHRYGFPAGVIPDTFRKVRRLLGHEVNFKREQATLIEAQALYQSMPGIRIPRLMRPLCTRQITALSEERGTKVTSAAAHVPTVGKRKIAEQLMEALVAVPLLAPMPNAIFHGDPHAGNLLYDNRTGELAIIDWALRERLSQEQRRHLALLFLMVSLRDPVGAANEIRALSQHRIRRDSQRGTAVRKIVSEFLNGLPPSYLPSAADTMRLLERVAMKGIRFPASLIMLSKVMFTLDGILRDILGEDRGIGLTIARRVAQHWITRRSLFRSPLRTRDWIMLQCSALLFGGRLWVQWEKAMLNRFLKKGSIASPAAKSLRPAKTKSACAELQPE